MDSKIGIFLCVQCFLFVERRIVQNKPESFSAMDDFLVSADHVGDDPLRNRRGIRRRLGDENHASAGGRDWSDRGAVLVGPHQIIDGVIGFVDDEGRLATFEDVLTCIGSMR